MASSSCQRAHSCFQTKQANKTLFAPIQVPLSRYSSRKGFDFLHIIITISKHNNKKTTKNRDYIDAYFTLSSNRPLEHPAPRRDIQLSPAPERGLGLHWGLCSVLLPPPRDSPASSPSATPRTHPPAPGRAAPAAAAAAGVEARSRPVPQPWGGRPATAALTGGGGEAERRAAASLRGRREPSAPPAVLYPLPGGEGGGRAHRRYRCGLYAALLTHRRCRWGGRGCPHPYPENGARCVGCAYQLRATLLDVLNSLLSPGRGRWCFPVDWIYTASFCRRG